MQPVTIGERDVAAYEPVVGRDAIDELRALAEPLRGKRVLHVNATPRGGGVAEILKSEVPLLRSLGIDAAWWALEAEPEFFETTKKIHHAIQGHRDGLVEDGWTVYEQAQQANAATIPAGEFDLIVVHDPQPMGLAEHARDRARSWIWRLHVDSSAPDSGTWRRLRPLLDHYEAAIFTLDSFVPPDVPTEKARIVAPAIDPLTRKNRSLPLTDVINALSRIGLDPGRPLMTQVARLDVWKDPWGVIEAYRMVREEVPGVQLALLGVIEAVDDPEAYEIYQQVADFAAPGGRPDPDIKIYIDPKQIGQVEVAAVQTQAQVVFQKSLREGFGLSVSEALWKATPVIGGKVGGIPLQINDGVSGYLVENPQAAAEAAIGVLTDPPEARELGARGRQHVREHFLITRLIRDELEIYQQALGLVEAVDV